MQKLILKNSINRSINTMLFKVKINFFASDSFKDREKAAEKLYFDEQESKYN